MIVNRFVSRVYFGSTSGQALSVSIADPERMQLAHSLNNEESMMRFLLRL